MDLSDGEIASDEEFLDVDEELHDTSSAVQSPSIVDESPGCHDFTNGASPQLLNHGKRVIIDSISSENSEVPRDAERTDTATRMMTVLDIPRRQRPLPEGWVPIQHFSGVPLYLHKPSNVATFAMPFSIELSQCVKEVDPPLSAIPCLEYTYHLEEKQRLRDAENAHSKKIEEATEDGQNERMKDKIHVISESRPEIVDDEMLFQYVKKRFCVVRRSACESTVINRKKLKLAKAKPEKETSSADRRVELVVKVGEDSFERFTLSAPNHYNRTYITVLNDFCTRALKQLPHYACQTLASSTGGTPGSSGAGGGGGSARTHCVLRIGDVKYAEATAVGKKAAKQLAARDALQILCPEILGNSADGTRETPDVNGTSSSEPVDDQLALSIAFKQKVVSALSKISITDPAVHEELKAREANQYAPLALLNQCCVRNLSPSCLKVDSRFEVIRNDDSSIPIHRCDMRVGQGDKYRAEATAKTQNMAAQRAAAKILQDMHPSLTNYASLIRLYGIDPDDVQQYKERQIRDAISQANSTSAAEGGESDNGSGPCETILQLLREEMRKVKNKTGDRATDSLLVKPDDPEFFYTKLWAFNQN